MFSGQAVRPPLVEREQYQLARPNDVEPSHEAARRVQVRLNALQRKVLAILVMAGPQGLTDLRLQERGANSLSTLRTRRAELVEAGLVEDTGRRVVQDGTSRTIWRVTEKGKRVFASQVDDD
jgi:hypothetical protein